MENGTGVHVSLDSHDNWITENDVEMNNQGIYVQNSHRNMIVGNTVRANGNGIRVESFSDGTVIRGNTVVDQSNSGILLQIEADGSTVTGNTTQAFAGPGTNNLFNEPAPDGGNYWDTFDQPAEGCIDAAPADGFCDDPFVFVPGQDNLPWTTQDGWVNPDADGDGVADDMDVCPGTTGNPLVDGCDCQQILDLKPGKGGQCNAGLLNVFRNRIGWAQNVPLPGGGS